MPDIERVTVLLADADALRRDGLAAVLTTNSEIDIVAGCADGQDALDTIRDVRPDVAVIDLNLPLVHGIELVRRVRSESLGTKIVIVSGTQDDEIIREVVRAGADAYLLKNGPARHVIDAIRYVRDGGQYFSPQLGRDGRDRHLLEEPPRTPAESTYTDTRPVRERRARPRTADRFRERIREEAPRDLRDRDYDIMSQMADGIRPILDRLDEIEGRVVEMESGEEPVPQDPRGWLNEELADSLNDSRGSDSRGSRRDRGRSGMSSRDMEARLPQMIEEAVTRRFQSMAGKLQEQIEEQHVKTLETFVKNIQVKLVQRVSVLEQNMSQQAEAMHQLREYNQRTEDNLSRLITGVDKLATELPKRLAAAKAESNAAPAVEQKAESSGKEIRKEKGNSSGSVLSRRKNLGPKIFWVLALLALVGFGIFKFSSRASSSADSVPAPGTEVQTAADRAAEAAKHPPKAAPPPPGADTKTKLQAAKEAADRKEYVEAEDIYKQVVQAEPQNEEALRGLASVLYRENKLEESAEVLEKLPKH